MKFWAYHQHIKFLAVFHGKTDEEAMILLPSENEHVLLYLEIKP